MSRITESRRKSEHGFDIVVRGENVKPTDAVLAEVLMEMAAEVGGTREFKINDPATMEEIVRRLKAKGVSAETMQWLC